MFAKGKSFFKSVQTLNSSKLVFLMITGLNKLIMIRENFTQRKLFFSFSNIIKMEIRKNINSDQPINQTDEENPTTFEKLKSLLDVKQVKYTLLEVNIIIFNQTNYKIILYMLKVI